MSDQSATDTGRRKFGKTCPECGVEFWKTLEDEQKTLELFKGGGVVNLVGSPGAGKSHLAIGAIAWDLLHVRTCTFFILTNVAWEKCQSVTEYDIDVEEDGVAKKVHKRIPLSEECAAPHPRIIGVENLVQLLVAAAKIQKEADRLNEDYRIVFIQDEAPVSQVGSGSKVVSSYTATSPGLMALLTLMRRYGGGGMTYVPISLSEELLMTKLRSQGDSSIPGLVTAVMSKDPNTIREVAAGRYRGARLSTRYLLEKPLIEYAAVVPNLYGWEPSIKWVPPITPLACPLNRMEPGTVSFTTKGISGFGTGNLPDGRPFRPEGLIAVLTGVHPSKVPDRVLEYLLGSEQTVESEENVTDEQLKELGSRPEREEAQTESEPKAMEPESEPLKETMEDRLGRLAKAKERKTLLKLQKGLEMLKDDPSVDGIREFARRIHVGRSTVSKFESQGLVTLPERWKRKQDDG